ncbi:alpha/beta hydrolase [Devosia pacifica]|uniref:Alpha/beta hydrolase n=1 Tax=Devosia pacifica TaxID=1335967 RepID=A0A918RVH0_9HYPH|nr:alpha/beta hydrolase [Devosia pacifica]
MIVLVAGAFNDHNTGAEFAAELSASYTVVTYDRRGRGVSGDAAHYAPVREIEDLAAVIGAHGDTAIAIGFSSGASLALMAAAAALPISKLVLIDAPWMLSEARVRPDPELAARLRSLVKAGNPGEAVELFQRDYVGIPEDVIVHMRNAPFRPFLEKMALSTSYDAEIMRDLRLPNDILPNVTQPVLVLTGEKSPPWMAETAATIAKKLPEGESDIVAGIGHDLVPAIIPYLTDFLERQRS